MNFTMNLVYQIKNLQIVFNNFVCESSQYEKSDWKIFLRTLEDVIYMITYVWLLFTFAVFLYNKIWNCSKYPKQKVQNYYNLDKGRKEEQTEQQEIAQNRDQEVVQTANASESQQKRWKDFTLLQRNKKIHFRQQTELIEGNDLNEVAQDEVAKSKEQPQEQQLTPPERKPKRYSSTWKTKPRATRDVGTFIT